MGERDLGGFLFLFFVILGFRREMDDLVYDNDWWILGFRIRTKKFVQYFFHCHDMGLRSTRLIPSGR